MEIRKSQLAGFAARLREEEKSEATVEKYCREARRFAQWLGERDAGGEIARTYKELLAEERTPPGSTGRWPR
ncbi:MAG: hypothetical protein K2O45_17695 [Oscillospiraceae bacterium]|nr:hypothetical protein [Oscillospiraceae bacterium]